MIYFVLIQAYRLCFYVVTILGKLCSMPARFLNNMQWLFMQDI